MSKLKYMIIDEVQLCVPQKTFCEQLAFDESLKSFREMTNLTHKEGCSSFKIKHLITQETMERVYSLLVTGDPINPIIKRRIEAELSGTPLYSRADNTGRCSSTNMKHEQ